MRRLLAPLIVLALILGGLWLGGESLMAQQLRRIAAGQPAAELGAVQELREPGRIGVRALALGMQTDLGRVELPQAELWLSPLRPTELRLALPPGATLDPGSGPVALGLGDAAARLRVQPLNGLAMASAGIMRWASAASSSGSVVSAVLAGSRRRIWSAARCRAIVASQAPKAAASRSSGRRRSAMTNTSCTTSATSAVRRRESTIACTMGPYARYKRENARRSPSMASCT